MSTRRSPDLGTVEKRNLTFSQEYRDRANRVIPSGTNCLSRGADNWVQGVAPNFIQRGQGDVACIIMEPVYAEKPDPGFLKSVKELTHAAGAVLIYDEIFTGFRWALGGAQEYFGITPDLARFSKVMKKEH